MANPVVRRTGLIYKVLILGNRPSLQAGFLNQASGSALSYQLYTALGIGIGVARVPSSFGTIALQLWLIPSQERFVGMTRGLTRGARSSFIILREEDLGSLSRLLSGLTPDQRDSLFVVVVGSVFDRENVRTSIENALQEDFDIRRVHSVQEALQVMSEVVVSSSSNMRRRVQAMLLNERHCPEFQFQPNQVAMPVNTEEEIRVIRRLASSLGMTVSDTAGVVNLEVGMAQLEFATGTVVFRSRLCEECRQECKKEERICIVGQDKGWSSEGMGPRALLTMAKLQALHAREFPPDVKQQIERAASCSRFTRKHASDTEGSTSEPSTSVHRIRLVRPTLLEEAERRVKQGRLPSSVYNMLKGMLQHAEGRLNRAEGADSTCR
jgi:hypothetical protein